MSKAPVKSPLTWMCLWCFSIGAQAAEYTILSNFKEAHRADRALTGSAEFINANGLPNPNSIGSAPFSGNIQAPAGMATSYGIMSDERTVLETYTLATVNHTYYDKMDELFRLMGENNAKFGEGKVFAVHGKLVHVTSAKDLNDHTACHPNIRGTNGHGLPVEPWIALIKRGVCKFEDKVKHAYNYNAIGVIIYNDRDSQVLDKMQIVDKERNITSVFTYRGIGEQLADLLEKGLEVNTTITPGETVTKQFQNMNRTSVLFVSISFIILMVISLVWLVFYYVQRFRYLQSKDKQSRRMCNVAKRIIAKIPTKVVKPEDKELQNECCPICIEQYRASDLIRVLPCKHEFHKNCIDPWLLDHRLCPMCKMDILKHYGFVFTGSQESILQMDLDVGEGDMDDDDQETDHRGISPMPQIRPSERMLSRSSSLNSVVDIQVMTEATPSLSEHWERNDESPSTTSGRRPSCPVQPYTDAVKDPPKDTQTEVQIQVYDDSVPCKSDASDNKGSGSSKGAQDYV